MNFAQQALQSAFVALRSTNGEPLLFRGAVLQALVNRSPFDRVIRTPDFDPRDAARIELRADEVDAIPRAGEEFIDANGISHRIESVRRAAPFYRCECVSAEPVLPFLATEGGSILLTEAGEALQIG